MATRTKAPDQMTEQQKQWVKNSVLILWSAGLAALVVMQIYDHAMWRDELQAWAIVSDSDGVVSFFHNLSFEGFPPLWHLSLAGLRLVTHNPDAMQILQGAFALGNLFLIARFAPLPLVGKMLVLASYPIAFQYAVPSRCYAMGLFFLISALVAWRGGRQNLGWVLLALGGQTTILETGIALVLGLHRLARVPDAWRDEKKGMVIFATLFLVALLVALPTEERMGLGDMPLSGNLHRFFTGLMYVFSGPYTMFPSDTTMVTLVVALFAAVAFFAFQRDIKAFAAWGLIVGGFLAVDQFGYGLVLHHLYLVPVAFVLIVWQRGLPLRGQSLAAFGLFLVLLSAGGARSLVAFYDEPFSQSRNVAAWIEKQGLKDAFWISLPDYVGTPVAARLDRKFYFPSCDCFATAARWDRKRVKDQALPQLVGRIKAEMKRRGADEALLLMGNVYSDEALTTELFAGLAVKPIKLFAGAQVPDEQYVVLHLRLAE